MADIRYVRGSDLCRETQEEILRTYVYRWTHENSKQNYHGECVACAQQRQTGGHMVVNGIAWHLYHVPLISDKKWLEDHCFVVNADGRTLNRRHKHAYPAFYVETERGGVR